MNTKWSIMVLGTLLIGCENATEDVAITPEMADVLTICAHRGASGHAPELSLIHI